MLPTLARRNTVEQITGGYGFVIVDECHHVAASAFTDVLNRIPARYWLGLTATPYRRDELDDLIYHQLGTYHHTLDTPAAGQLPPRHRTRPRHTPSCTCIPPVPLPGDADPRQPGGMAEIYRALVADTDRLDQIVTDIADAHREGANILVLTSWVEHLEAMTARLTDVGFGSPCCAVG